MDINTMCYSGWFRPVPPLDDSTATVVWESQTEAIGDVQWEYDSSENQIYCNGGRSSDSVLATLKALVFGVLAEEGHTLTGTVVWSGEDTVDQGRVTLSHDGTRQLMDVDRYVDGVGYVRCVCAKDQTSEPENPNHPSE
jgi:hypothetical protein